MFDVSVLPSLSAILPPSSLTFLSPSTPKFLVLSNRAVPLSLFKPCLQNLTFSPPQLVKIVSLTISFPKRILLLGS